MKKRYHSSLKFIPHAVYLSLNISTAHQVIRSCLYRSSDTHTTQNYSHFRIHCTYSSQFFFFSAHSHFHKHDYAYMISCYQSQTTRYSSCLPSCNVPHRYKHLLLQRPYSQWDFFQFLIFPSSIAITRSAQEAHSLSCVTIRIV